MESAAVVVEYDGQTFQIEKFGPADLVAFERRFGVSASVFDGTSGDVRFEWICFLVWRGLRRLGAISKDLEFDDEFLEGIDDVEMTTSDEGADAVNPPDVSPPRD
jgi:hypothetical protein